MSGSIVPFGQPRKQGGGQDKPASSSSKGAQPATGSYVEDLSDQALSHSYAIKIDGTEVKCLSCSGFGMETDYTEVEVGGQSYPEKLLERTRFSNVSLTRVLDRDSLFAEWYNVAQKLRPAPKDKVCREVSICVKNRKGQEIKRWTLVDAVPCRFSGPELATGEFGVPCATETIVLSYKGIIENLWQNA